MLPLIVVLAGCGRDDIRVYRLAKPEGQDPQQPAGMPTMAGEPAASPGMPKLQWKTPAGWKEVAASQMRLASFKIKGKDKQQADVGVFPLPGLAGKDLDNVNRWRGQVGLSAISEEEMNKLAQPVEIDGQPGQVYDMAGENAASGEKTRILAAIQRRDGIAWFFKMTGDDTLVGEQKNAFVDFLKSLSFQAPADVQLPPSHPPIDGGIMPTTLPMNEPVTASTEGRPKWELPTTWKETAAGQFLVAKFLVAGDNNQQAAVNVSASAGDGGGLLNNLNRWRGQLGLPPVAEGDLSKNVQVVDAGSAKASFVDMTGADPRTGQKARLVAAVVPQGGQTWFYKMMGNEQLVEREKNAFTQFVQTARY